MTAELNEKQEEPPGGASPIALTIAALEKQLSDASTHDKARRQLDSVFRWNLAGEAAAILGALAAGAASTSYFVMLREQPIWEEGDFLLPMVIWAVVSAASWYMYRLDVVESFVNLSAPMQTKKDEDACGMRVGFCAVTVMCAVLFIVAMDLALMGYGVFEVLEDCEAFQIAAVVLVCFASVLAEGAQQYKYIKDVFNWEQLKKMLYPDDAQSGRFYFYSACSLFAMIFYSMTVFNVLEEMGKPAAVFIVGIYVLFSMPYYCNKAADQVRVDRGGSKVLSLSGFNAARAGNMFGDIAFSLYGFFETMQALGVISKPSDVFDDHDPAKTAGLLIFAFCVVVATCISSCTLTAGGDRPGYFAQLNDARKKAPSM